MRNVLHLQGVFEGNITSVLAKVIIRSKSNDRIFIPTKNVIFAINAIVHVGQHDLILYCNQHAYTIRTVGQSNIDKRSYCVVRFTHQAVETPCHHYQN